MLGVVQSSLAFRAAALLSLPPDPTYAILLLSIGTIVISAIKIVYAASRALR